MKLEDIRRKLASEDYSFLRTNEHLGENVILLCLGGSHAYGMDTETSDLDIRGCALNTKRELLTGNRFEQSVNTLTDTTVYAFNKLVSLLSDCNPNTIEMLGLKPEHYLYINDIGKELLDNRKLFLSKRAVASFGGYATSQLRRLDNKSARLLNQTEQEKHIRGSVESLMASFAGRYAEYPGDAIKLYVDASDNPNFDSEIFMDVHLTHYPLRDYKNMWSEMNNVVKDYSRLGQRNEHAIEHNKLGKHMAHLIRLYYMAFDILEKEEIVTYREAEHDMLMGIRNGDYLDDNRQPIPEFFEMVDELEKRLKYDADNTSLPSKPDYNKISDFVVSVNERVVR